MRFEQTADLVIMNYSKYLLVIQQVCFCTPMFLASWNQCFFFNRVQIFNTWLPKKTSVIRAKDFCQRKVYNHQIWRNFFLKLPCLENRLQQVIKILQESLICALSSLTCSQIWLIPFVE